MKYQNLISRSLLLLEDRDDGFHRAGFQGGAEWMCVLLGALRPEKSTKFNSETSFSYYGSLKYALCLFFGLFPILFQGLTAFTGITFVFIFYIIEIQFLFLFPLLLDGNDHPMKTNFSMIYKIGFFQCLFIVIPIASYMIIGLFNFKKPFKNWYIGCLSILILYVDETSNR